MEVTFSIPNPKPAYPYMFPVIGGFIGSVVGVVGAFILYFSLVKEEKESSKTTSNNLAGAVVETCVYGFLSGIGYCVGFFSFMLIGLIGGSAVGSISGTYLAKRIGS